MDERFDNGLRCHECNRRSGSGGFWPVVIVESGDLCSDCKRRLAALLNAEGRKVSDE